MSHRCGMDRVARGLMGGHGRLLCGNCRVLRTWCYGLVQVIVGVDGEPLAVKPSVVLPPAGMLPL
jgi:hypothetical protein